MEREMGINPLSVPTISTRIKEAEELGATHVLIGSFETSGTPPGDSLILSLAVVDPVSLRRSQVPEVGPVPVAELAALQERASSTLLAAETIDLPSTRPPPPPAAEAAPAAYEAMVKSLLEEDPEKRVVLLDRALRADPAYLRARLEVAFLLVDMDREDRAVQRLSAVTLTGQPGEAAEAERLLGRLHLKAGNPTAAVDALRRSLRWSNEASTHIALARALAARGDLEVASAELELARRIDPDDPEIEEVRALIEARSRAEQEGTGD
jgi:tetratricopeptide (TPR) repeat protein